MDAGAASAIYDALIRLAEAGTAIVVISQDLDEIFSLCDTIAVLAGGELSAKRRVADTSIAEVGLLMGSASKTDTENTDTENTDLDAEPARSDAAA